MKREQVWDTKYGLGFPGWHLECSTMAMSILGEQIDIHTGGIDHIQIHHNNEIAQSESVTGKQFSKYWMHVEHITIDKEKISKSIGNVITINELIEKGFSPIALRYLFSTVKYNSQLDFKYSSLIPAQKKTRRIT